MIIDWNEAPEWAIGHGIVVTCNIIKEVWFGDKSFMYVGDSRSYVYGGGAGETRHNITRGEIQVSELRPAAWSGEGLPPVGTVCEYNNYEPHPVDVELKWSRVEIVARHTQGLDDFAVFASVSGYHGSRVPEHFRPIRTPGQIAAEERESEIRGMRDIILHTVKYASGEDAKNYAEVLFDAGYRKQVKP